MKKLFVLIFVLAFCTAIGFAQDISIGADISFEASNNNLNVEYLGTEGDETITMSRLAAEAFIDATYIQACVGYSMFLNGEYKTSGGFGSSSADLEGKLTYLTVAAYGKYPILLQSGATFFPMAGLEYMSNMAYEDEDGNDLKDSLTSDQKDDLNQLWIKAGAGLDLNINETMYFRGTALVGYKLNSELEKDIVDTYESAGAEASYTTLDFEIGVGLGFKL